MNVVVSKNGGIILPTEYRKKYHLKPGSTIQVVEYGGVLALTPDLSDPVKQTFGLLAAQEGQKRLTQALIEERKAENGCPR